MKAKEVHSCEECGSTNVYVLKKTGEFVCRRCGKVTAIKGWVAPKKKKMRHINVYIPE